MRRVKNDTESPKPKASRPRRKGARIPPVVAQASAEALTLADRASQRLKERHTAVRHAFIGLQRQSDGSRGDPGLAVLLRGSRGGAVRLKFYLALLWVAGGGDERHSATWPARTWAALLDLPDPERLGDRRIRDAIRALEQEELLRTERQPGRPIRLILRCEDGTRRPYTHPGAAARAAKEKNLATKEKARLDPSHFYVQLPASFWTRGWAVALSGPAVAMLLVMLMLTESGKKNAVWISPEEARSRFRLSEDTWTRGTAELRRHGLLDVGKKPVSEDFGWRRVRNTYTVNAARLDDNPAALTDAAETGDRPVRKRARRARKPQRVPSRKA